MRNDRHASAAAWCAAVPIVTGPIISPYGDTKFTVRDDREFQRCARCSHNPRAPDSLDCADCNARHAAEEAELP